ncbi:cocaine- and amphetamine-regulated transcript protein [Callorhinchus milii]|uniref:Cocaine-and amphetamine-regulated transcript protein-like protein n=1 Tax=Callorhinchus milii TaxID=7868 RepID=V9LGG3_CALMI|nr:cocaine- and amphetamine-regulated transcript protein [Callorhinchus milii]
MESCNMLGLLLCVSVLLLLCQGQSSRELSSAEDYPAKTPNASTEKELFEAVEEILGKLHNAISPSYEKKAGQIPKCDIGDRCAIKQGPRIGKLCDCARGTTCNSFLLKCI